MPPGPCVLVIQNDAHEDAGLLATILAERGIRVVQELAWEHKHDRVVPTDFCGLVLLGGPQVSAWKWSGVFMRDRRGWIA